MGLYALADKLGISIETSKQKVLKKKQKRSSNVHSYRNSFCALLVTFQY